jgi:hypothetical protein
MCQVNNASWCLDVVDCVVRIVASLVESGTKHATSQNGRLHLLEFHMQPLKLGYYKCHCS